MVQSYYVVPLTTALRRLGAMGFGSTRRRIYQETEIGFIQQVAQQVAVAVDNVLHDESARSAQEQLTHERDRMRLLLEVNNAVVSHLSLDDLFLRSAPVCEKSFNMTAPPWSCMTPKRAGTESTYYLLRKTSLHRRRNSRFRLQDAGAYGDDQPKAGRTGEQDLKDLAEEVSALNTGLPKE